MHVAAVLSLSGNLKLRGQGQTCKEALEFVRDMVNAQEVIPLNRGMDITFLDDESDPSTAGARARDAVTDGAFLVAGGLTSAQTLAMERETGPHGMVQVSPFAGATAVADAQGELRTRFLFSLSPTIKNGSPQALVKYLSELNNAGGGPGCKRTIVVHNDDVTGGDFFCAYANTFRLNSMCVLDHVPIPTSLVDSYADAVSTVIEAKPDCVILAANADVAGAVLEEVERRFPPPTGVPWTWMGNTQTHSPEFLQTTLTAGAGSRSRAEGFFGADVDFAPRRLAYSQLLDLYNSSLVKRGQAALAELPPRFSVCADLAMLAALTIERAGPKPSPEGIRDAFIDVATFSPGDITVTPAQLVDGLRSIRRGVAIDFKGAASDDELSDDGMMRSSPLNIWRVANDSFDERVRQYGDGETSDVLVAKPLLSGCPPIPDSCN